MEDNQNLKDVESTAPEETPEAQTLAPEGSAERESLPAAEESAADLLAEAEPTAEAPVADMDAGEIAAESPAAEGLASEGPAAENSEADSSAVAEAQAPVAEAPAPEAKPAAPKKEYKHAWYVVHCYSGYENKVKKSLEQHIVSDGMQDRIFRVVVPVEREVEIKEGQRKQIERRIFPGYIMVEMMELHEGDPESDQAWYVVRNTPGVTGFVQSGDKPEPLRQDDVDKILKRMETAEPKVHVTFRPGQTVHIIDGPFADFRGTVDEVNMEKGKVRVMVSFFGRETPVELDLLQVERV